MKILLLKVLFFLLYLPQLSAQQFTSAAFPNEDGLIELWVPDICGATHQWQESPQETDDWQDVPGATSHTLMMEVPPAAIGEKQFRVRATIPPATEPEYSYAFSVQVIDSLEELGVGDFYNGVFIYASRPDTILGSIFTNLRATYGCNSSVIPNAVVEGVGGGIQNTENIRNNCTEQGSVGTVFDTLSLMGYEDWFLPSIDGLRLAINGYYDNQINEITGIDTAFPFLSSTQNENRPDDRFFAIQSGGLLRFNLPKDQEGHVIAARRITQNDAPSYRAQTLWPKYQFPELLTLENTPEGSEKVEVEYLGVDLPGNAYVLGTSESMRYQAGEGAGPYLLANNFGGYQRFELQVVNSGCHTLRLRSPIFKIDQSHNIEAPFPETHRGEMAWGDYNNDGLKDLLITGTDTTALYRNLGNDQFGWEPDPFPALSYSFADWGDLDNDNDLDLVLMGLSHDGTSFTGIYLNEGIAGLELSTHQLPQLHNGFAQWIDYDTDGQLELLLSGETASGEPLTKLFRLGAAGGVMELPSTLPSLKNSSVSIDDYNRDNYPDLILMGNDRNERTTRIFRNDLGTFVALSDSIIGLEHGAASWTDFNKDGLLDFAIAGNKDTLIYQVGPGSVSAAAGQAGWLTLFQNDGNDHFTEVGRTSNKGNDFFDAYLFPIFSFADIDAGDYDNDGDDDLILSGIPAISWVSSGSTSEPARLIYRSIAQIMRNDNEAGFVGIEPDVPANWSFPSFNHDIPSTFECSTIGFVDVDGDNQLDIFRGGRSYSPAAVYKWPNGVVNQQPALPTGLNASTGCDSVLLDWHATVDDDHTLAAELTYELYLQHQDSSLFVFSPSNDEALRNVQLLVRDLSPGTYRWGVQVTDRAQAKSGFREGPEFTITVPPVPLLTNLEDTLYSSAEIGNQWYNETGLIPGATEPTFIIPVSGTYYNIVTIDGCPSPPSAAIDLFLTGTDERSASNRLEVWPSPAGDYIHFQLKASFLDFSYHIYSTHGKQVMGGNLAGSQRVLVSHLIPGIYIIALETPAGMISQRFVKGE